TGTRTFRKLLLTAPVIMALTGSLHAQSYQVLTTGVTTGQQNPNPVPPGGTTVYNTQASAVGFATKQVPGQCFCDVDVTISGLPAGVVATFNPANPIGAVAAGNVPITITITVPAGLPGG